MVEPFEFFGFFGEIEDFLIGRGSWYPKALKNPKYQFFELVKNTPESKPNLEKNLAKSVKIPSLKTKRN